MLYTGRAAKVFNEAILIIIFVLTERTAQEFYQHEQSAVNSLSLENSIVSEVFCFV